MKTTNQVTRFIRSCAFTCASTLVLGVLVTANSANAQYKPTGEDGITASPRLRAQLNERAVRPESLVAAQPAMSCPKCKDAWVTQTDNPKGLGARTLIGAQGKLVASHLCPGCGADMTVSGTGRAKQTVASHKCSSCGVEDIACCSKKGSSTVATKGMDQNFKVAPVK